MHFMSTGVTPLGWLPTRNFYPVGGSAPQLGDGDPVILPKIFMGILLFPPSYLQELYFRMVITHFFEFKEFRGISMKGPLDVYNKWFTSTSGGQAAAVDTGEILDDTSLDLTDAQAKVTSAGVF